MLNVPIILFIPIIYNSEQKKWDANDWKKHNEWLEKRAAPKKEFKEKLKVNKKKTLLNKF